jgi:hypothetical protein
VKNQAEAQQWLDNLLRDAKRDLNLNDEDITELLLRNAVNYYLKTVARRHLAPKEAS